ncbi:MFS transporter [Sphingopyxis sp. MSC1_008]|uniref:MFS transporter n=1 Tax=Sphingopyxis sp. MSC1_008 TaxID=2909265 RepID=UPI0020C16D8D
MQQKAEWREGWPVVMGAALALGTALPVWNYVSSLFVAPLTAEFGWTRGQLASASASAFLGSLAAPLIGKLADAVGSRPVLLGGLAGYAAAFVTLAYQPGTLAAYTVIIMMHTMIGIACGGAIFSRAVAGWFDRSRGLALGLTMTGVPLAAALITPALSHIITSYGWQNGFLFLASLSLLLGFPAVLLMVKDRHRISFGKHEQVDPVPVEGADWRQIIRSRGFWLLALSLIPINAAGTGIMSAMMPMLTDSGISPARAATLVSLFAISVIVARLATGWLIDRLPSYAVAGVVASIPAVGCALLVLHEGNYMFAAIALILIGVQQGAEIDLVGYLVAKLFGLRNYASVYGVCVVFLGLSGAFGVAWFGQSFDANASYLMALAISVPCYLIGAALLLALRSDIQRSNAE